MLTNESQVRLAVTIGGRLGAKASNAFTKRQIRKLGKAIKHGANPKGFKYNEPEIQACSQSLLISSEAVQYYISEESRPGKFKPSEWKKKKPVERLEVHLQITADDLAGRNGAIFTYQIIN